MTERTVEDVVGRPGELRAGGTDVEARRRLGLAGEPLVDLAGIGGLSGVERLDGGRWRVGSMTRLGTLVGHGELARSHPAVAEAAWHCGPPQIRAVATVGGNLLQHTRCPYVRTGRVHCHKTGGDACPARGGDLRFGAAFDFGPCAAPHPSTLAVALLAHDAVFTAVPGGARAIGDLFGDGRDPTRDHRLDSGTVLTAVEIPPGWPGEVAVHHRATVRNTAEWPLAEVTVRLQLVEDVVRAAAVAAGGVAPVPLRLGEVEETLVGSSRAGLHQAARLLVGRPGPDATRFKLDVLAATLEAAFDRVAEHDVWRPFPTAVLD